MSSGIRWREISPYAKTIGVGAFYDSIHARTEDVAAVQMALDRVAMQRDSKFLMGPALNGWICILPGGHGPDESLSQEIAKNLSCDILHLAVHDDDVFLYRFYRGGKLVDEYNSNPEYFDEVIKGNEGHPELFRHLLPDASSLEKLKKLLDAKRFTFESERMSEFADLFKLSNTSTSYNYARGGKGKRFSHIEYKPRSPDDYNKRGEARLAKKDFDGASADFKKALGLDPNFVAAQENCRRSELARKITNADSYVHAGLALRKMGQLDEALVHFNKALEFDPHNAAAYNSRGLTKKQKGNRDEALADFNKAIELNPNLSAAYINRAGVKRDDGSFDEALADYDRAIESKPDSANAYNQRGELKWKRGDANGALADFNKAIELNPDSAMAYNNRGESKRMKGDVEGAMADYNRAIELKPDSALVYCNRSVARRMKRDLEGAMADCDRAIELKPELAVAYNNRGMIKKDKGDLDGALSDVDTAISLEPKAEGFRNNRDKLIQIKNGPK